MKDEGSLGQLQRARQTLDRTLQRKFWSKKEPEGYTGARAGSGGDSSSPGSSEDSAPANRQEKPPQARRPAQREQEEAESSRQQDAEQREQAEAESRQQEARQEQANAAEVSAAPEDTPAEVAEKNWLKHDNPGCKTMLDKRSRWYNWGKKDAEQLTINEGAALCRSFNGLKDEGIAVRVKADKLKAKIQAVKREIAGYQSGYDSKVRQVKTMTNIIDRKYNRIMEREAKLGSALAEIGSAIIQQWQSSNYTGEKRSGSDSA